MAERDADVIEAKVTELRPQSSGTFDPGQTHKGNEQSFAAPKDFGKPLGLGIAVILIGLGGFLLWAAFAPLDEGVPSPGTIIVDSKRKTVQNFGAGAVKTVHVREGDRVRANDLLITMDPTQARAQREIADSLYVTARASEARLLAEQRQAESIKLPKDLVQRSTEPSVELVLQSQQALFLARRKSLSSELAAFEETISGLAAQMSGLESVQEQRSFQIKTLENEVAALGPLVTDGLYAKNRYLELERELANHKASFAEGIAGLARLRFQIAEVKLRATQREQEYRKEVEAQLSEVTKEARAQSERIVALEDDLKRTEIRAPVDGSVVGLNVSTLGAVLAAGTRVLDIIPEKERLIVEAQIQPHLIERIKAGIPAKLMFTALNPRTTPVVDGRLLSISADLLTTPQGTPYYLARVEVPDSSLKILGTADLHPGMPVEVIFVTGERSLLNYLFKPIQDRTARGLKER